MTVIRLDLVQLSLDLAVLGIERPDAIAAVKDAVGGGEHPMEVFRRFRGRDPRPEALLRQKGLLRGSAEAGREEP